MKLTPNITYCNSKLDDYCEDSSLLQFTNIEIKPVVKKEEEVKITYFSSKRDNNKNKLF